MIIVVCGPPGVGKTTVATLLRQRLDERGHPVELLDSDEFARNTYDRLYGRVADSDRDWIVAGTFYKRPWQERFEGLDDVMFVYLDTDLDTCLERNRSRDDPIDDEAVHIVWREFDEPDADLTIDTTEQTPASIVDRIVTTIDRRFGDSDGCSSSSSGEDGTP